MGDFQTYQEFAFNHTLVDEFLSSNIYAKTSNGKIYYDDNGKVITFTSEDKALQYLLKTLDLSKHYRFFNVFYNVRNSADGKLKYQDYICLIARKTNKTRNHIKNFLTNPNSGTFNDGKLVSDEDMEDITFNTPYNTVDKDLTHICGMELEPIVQCAITIDDKTLYDLRDNFIVDEILPQAKDENKITCNILFNHINKAYKLSVKYIESTNKTNVFPDIALVDISGSYIKTTGLFDGEEVIKINDSLDIYREFIGDTTKAEEDFDTPTEPVDNANMSNDDNYT